MRERSSGVMVGKFARTGGLRLYSRIRKQGDKVPDLEGKLALFCRVKRIECCVS